MRQDRFIDELVVDENGDIVELTLGILPKADTVDDLLMLLPVMYFDVVDGAPDFLSMKASGFRFGEIASGADGWTTEEIEEFTNWAHTNIALQKWLASTLDTLKRQKLEYGKED